MVGPDRIAGADCRKRADISVACALTGNGDAVQSLAGADFQRVARPGKGYAGRAESVPGQNAFCVCYAAFIFSGGKVVFQGEFLCRCRVKKIGGEARNGVVSKNLRFNSCIHRFGVGFVGGGSAAAKRTVLEQCFLRGVKCADSNRPNNYLGSDIFGLPGIAVFGVAVITVQKRSGNIPLCCYGKFVESFSNRFVPGTEMLVGLYAIRRATVAGV